MPRGTLGGLGLVWLAFMAAARADNGPADYKELDPARHGAPLRAGASGPEVTALQDALAGACHPVPLTGRFDAATTAAVLSFQGARGCAKDGVVGPKTLAAFDVALGIGKKPSAGLVPLHPSQVMPAITKAAFSILAAHRTDDVGTEVPFTAHGRSYVGRIELHFHPIGGAEKPWGYHHGVTVYAAGAPPVAGLLPRAPGALTGSELMKQTASLSMHERDQAFFRELASGNVPDFLRAFVPVKTSAAGHEVVFHVLPDYLAVGSEQDFVRVPLEAPTAQRIADVFSASLPTKKMVDLIWRAASLELAPRPLQPGSLMTSNAWIAEENQEIQAELAGRPLGLLTAGDKKDLVLTNLLAAHPDRVAIYGWHELSGVAIQPLSTVHAASYYDYSHGIRLVSLDVVLDGAKARLDDVLRDPSLAALLSDEGPITQLRIP